jgi:hypothetical protein
MPKEDTAATAAREIWHQFRSQKGCESGIATCDQAHSSRLLGEEQQNTTPLYKEAGDQSLQFGDILKAYELRSDRVLRNPN